MEKIECDDFCEEANDYICCYICPKRTIKDGCNYGSCPVKNNKNCEIYQNHNNKEKSKEEKLQKDIKINKLLKIQTILDDCDSIEDLLLKNVISDKAIKLYNELGEY